MDALLLKLLYEGLNFNLNLYVYDGFVEPRLWLCHPLELIGFTGEGSFCSIAKDGYRPRGSENI